MWTPETTDMKLKIVLEPSAEDGFTAYVPTLPGCISEGETASPTVLIRKRSVPSTMLR